MAHFLAVFLSGPGGSSVSTTTTTSTTSAVKAVFVNFISRPTIEQGRPRPKRSDEMLLGQLRSLLRAVGVVLVVLGMDGVNAFSLSPQSTLALRGNWGRSPVSHQLGFACGAPSQRRGTSRSQKFEVMQANPQDSVSVTEVSPLRKYGLGALWVSFIVYGTLFSPAEAPGASLELLKETIKVTDNSVNPIFVALFGSLGVWPAVFSALLLPLKPKDQTLSPTPFLLGSFAA
eukprot:1872793-Rhodomonas_salina.1